MQKLAALILGSFVALQLVFAGSPAFASELDTVDVNQASGEVCSSVRTVSSVSWIEEWDPQSGQWVRVEDEAVAADTRDVPTVTTTIVNGVVTEQRYADVRAAARYSQPAPAYGQAQMLAQYGPFMVTSSTSAAMIGATDSSSPRHFEAMLRDFPAIALLEMVEAPGTSNDIANLAVGRRIREAGIATHVPRGGSVRSGAVELFLAGSTRTIEDGAEFAVHSWLDNYGREADDFAVDDPTHRLYLDYYVEMGMSETRAREFYAMTNSVPHATALWLRADDMRFWIRPEDRAAQRPSAQIDFGKMAGIVAKATTAFEQRVLDASQRAIPLRVQIGYSDLSETTLAELAPHHADLRAQPQLALAQFDGLRLDSGPAFP